MRVKGGRWAALAIGWFWLALVLAGCSEIGKKDGTGIAGTENEGPVSNGGSEGMAGDQNEEAVSDPGDRDGSGETISDADNSGSAGSASLFGSAPWFCMDFESNTKASGSWIYGYWGRQLCRVNKRTKKAEVLYEAKSPQAGEFCIAGDYVYFLEKRNVSSLDGERINLRFAKCDGSSSGLLAEEIPVTGGRRYDLNVWEDILYLTCSYGEEADYRFFRLTEEEKAEPVAASETLYGKLPEGYTDAREKKPYVELPDLPYCMTCFGYVFISDGEEKLYRFLPESGEREQVPFSTSEFSKLFLTNRELIYRKAGDTWYSVSLEDPGQVTEIGRMDCYSVSFWGEQGLYQVEQEYGEGYFRLKRLNRDGELETLHRYVKREDDTGSARVLFYDGEQLYFSRQDHGDGVVCRIPPEGTSDEAETFYVYDDSPLKEIRISETMDVTVTYQDSGARGEFSLTRVILTEETESARRINEFLEKEYEDKREAIEELKKTVQEVERGEGEWADWDSGVIVEYSVSASVSYIDSDYIGISMGEYVYHQGAAHGMYGSREYVFSRTTGERLRITDVVKKSGEEICGIIAPYVEAEAEWGTDEEGWESAILEDWRFFLAAEGIGIHFDVYEMGSYAAGSLDVIVPYEAFED